MTTHRFINWLLAAAVIAVWMTMAAHFDKQRFDGDARHETSLSAELRFARAAQQICGPNAAWDDLGDGQIQCRTKRGHKTMTAQVSE